jgi:hypothetical protein
MNILPKFTSKCLFPNNNLNYEQTYILRNLSWCHWPNIPFSFFNIKPFSCPNHTSNFITNLTIQPFGRLWNNWIKKIMKENTRRVGIFSINSIVFRFDPVQRPGSEFWPGRQVLFFYKKNQNDVVLVKKINELQPSFWPSRRVNSSSNFFNPTWFLFKSVGSWINPLSQTRF